MKQAEVYYRPDGNEIAERLVEQRQRLFEQEGPVTGGELMTAHSRALDSALSSLFEQSLTVAAHTPSEAEHVRTNVALAATGGYGREELAPFSDVDVSFIAAKDDDELVGKVVKAAYEAVVESLTDKLGLKIGYSYRVIGESEDLDLHTRTALLDLRRVTGSEEISSRFAREIAESLDARFVLEHIRSRSRSAELKPLYSVEPDVKTGFGGLRDFHTAGWVARAVLRCEPDMLWTQAAARGLLEEDEIERMLQGVEFIRRVRNALHLAAGRQLDALLVDRRSRIAAALDLSEDELLSSYYTAAEAVRSASERMWSGMADRRLSIDKPFALVGQEVTLLDRPTSLSRPGVALKAIALAQDYDVPVADELARQITRVCRSSPPSLDNPENRLWFRSSLDGPAAGEALASMADLGLLQELLPEFNKLMHKAAADESHELTIGAHSLLVAKTLDDMRRRQGSLYGDLWTSVAKPAVLYFAALMHDVGKLEETGEHAITGGTVVFELARRAGFSTNSSNLIEFLVSNHQTMADAARMHDLSNGAPVTEFASVVGDVTRLRMLFLLSVADVLSVGQASWAEMQCRFLEELYFEAEARTIGDAFAEPERVVNRRRRRLAQDLSLARLPEDLVREHIEVMPPEYLLNEQPEHVAGHVEQVVAVRRGRPTVTFSQHPESRITDMTVCAYDRHGLLGQVAGALYALDITVHSARVRTRASTDSIAIDTLSIDFLGDRVPYFKRKEIEQSLRSVLSLRSSAEDLIRTRGKASSPNPEIYSVQLADAPHYDRTVLEVRAEDVPGLLYCITSAIAHLGWDILSAKITTMGRKAVDTFTVHAQDGGKLPRDAPSRLKRALTNGAAGSSVP